MQRDWLLGFPPVLLAQDECCEAANFPLGITERVLVEYESRASYKRTRELLAFEMRVARPEITGDDCRQIKSTGAAHATASGEVATGWLEHA